MNAELLSLVPPGARRVVEAGCADGELARAYLARHPGCEYVGIEMDAARAALARPGLARVIEADIEGMDAAALGALAPVDAWVFGDVLEHLVDPWALLARVRVTLAPDGVVVACIPNMQHWSVAVRLVLGELFYEDAGLLDRTHLRWFTRATLGAMFRDAGYAVTRLERRVFDSPMRERALQAVGNFASVMGARPRAVMADADVFQWVVEARATRQEAVK